MSVEVSVTARAAQQIKDLRRTHRIIYDQFLAELRKQGCKALNYRLTGEVLMERLCAAHLARSMRVVVAFESSTVVTILLVGPHSREEPSMDVYTQLYELAGLSVPIGERQKPPCCGDSDGLPPTVEVDVLFNLMRRARALAGADKRRAEGRRTRR